MSAQMESFLARLIRDAEFRQEFRANPLATAAAFGLPSEAAQAAARLDMVGVEMFADAVVKKLAWESGGARDFQGCGESTDV